MLVFERIDFWKSKIRFDSAKGDETLYRVDNKVGDDI